uniref:G_PROTEIN_RECEP_F1_2 domain-containing protein n=1 Tax=Globodera pallida TaxID=36090 RepID=A0A183BVS9_GLOPA
MSSSLSLSSSPSQQPHLPSLSSVPLLLDMLLLNTSSTTITTITGITTIGTSITTTMPSFTPSHAALPSPPPPPSSVLHMRLALTITHLLLVSLGSVNLLVIFVILIRPYMRSITNVYMISLCLADFIYLTNLTLVAVTQLNDKSWPFSSVLCTMYHGTETTGKYASVMFVVLLAVDRYCAMCKSSWCSRYRTYRAAVLVSLAAWLFAALAASPLYFFAEVALLRLRSSASFLATDRREVHKLCIAKWPNSDVARWYITISSVLIFALPLAVIIFCYYHILNKLREALKSCKRMKRGASSRAPYHRVTRSPFWLFNLFSSIFRLRISTQFDRIVVNIIHLFPYVNCALNPILYVAHAENFRLAFRSLFCGKFLGRRHDELFDGSRTIVPGTNGFTLATAGGSSVLINGNTFGRLSVAGAHSPFKPRTFDRCSSSSEGILLTSPPTARALATQRLTAAVGGPGPGGAGSAPSLLLDCPKLPLRANSAKHSVITLESSGTEPTGGVRRREPKTERHQQGNVCEQTTAFCTSAGGAGGGGGGGGTETAAAALSSSNSVPFMSRVINAARPAQKRSLIVAKSPPIPLHRSNTGDQMPREKRKAEEKLSFGAEEEEADERIMGEEGDEFV